MCRYLDNKAFTGSYCVSFGSPGVRNASRLREIPSRTGQDSRPLVDRPALLQRDVQPAATCTVDGRRALVLRRPRKRVLANLVYCLLSVKDASAPFICSI